MPDISMCLNKTCPLKSNCYRFTAKPCKYMQTYSEFEVIKKGDKYICDYFWDSSKYTKTK